MTKSVKSFAKFQAVVVNEKENELGQGLPPATHEQIAEHTYILWEQGGRQENRSELDWKAAENLLSSKSA